MAKKVSAGTGDVNTNDYQRMLLQPFRMYDNTAKKWLPFGDALLRGGEQLQGLFRNPGSVNPNISGAIAPLVAAETDRIQRTGANQLSQAAGTMARTGAGGGMYAALEAAMNRANSRDIAGARRGAVAQSEGLRRQDLGTLLQTLQYLQDTTMQGRGVRQGAKAQSMQQNAQNQQNKAANLSTWGSVLNTAANLYLNYQTSGGYGAATQAVSGGNQTSFNPFNYYNSFSSTAAY